MVTQVLMNKDGKVTGVEFVRHGKTYKQQAKIVILSAYVVETPRLLLNSANAQFPDGLANSSGWVGQAFMTHSSHDVYGKFDNEIRLYKGTPVLATTQAFYRTDPKNDFVRGYTLHAHGSRPLEFVKGIAKSKNGLLWGEKLRDVMLNYNYYNRVTLVGEILPDETNCITLAEEKDEYGLPRAKVTFSYGENDLKLINHAVHKMSEIIEAAGGKTEFIVPDTAHLMGGCRMGNDVQTSVVNSYGQTHDIPNLFICDASIFVTSGGGNPTNTVMALAARTADYIIGQARMREL
jgi:choline dehydrogenase-like flavoprotein